jgi:hypothetical protein
MLLSSCLVVVLGLVATVKAACPSEALRFPQLETVPSLEQLNGVWLDQLSSRKADSHFYCTQQSNSKSNETSYRTDTTSSMVQGKVPYSASFVNVGVPQKQSEMVFELVPASRTAHWFTGSLFFLVDYRADDHPSGGYYSWMICNESDEYEFHVSAREGTDLTGVQDRVLGILDTYALNPQGQTFHQEPHDTKTCPSVNVVADVTARGHDDKDDDGDDEGECLARGDSCFRGDECCSGRCTSWNAIVWTCA